MTTATPAEAFNHGDAKRYRRGCRCTDCIKGVTAENRRNRYLRQTGRGIQCTPQRAANHINLLRAAPLSDAEIQRRAQIHPDVMYRILRREGTIHRDTERRVLAVPIPTNSQDRSGAYTASLGTRRRLRALAAEGWPSAELARHSERKKQYINYLQSDQAGETIRMWVAIDITNLYAQLRDRRPEDAGVPADLAERTRQRAAAKGWLGVAFWEDVDHIDDPDFDPAAVLAVPPRYMQLGQDALWLRKQGYNREQVAHRLGASIDYIDQSIKRYRTALGEAAFELQEQGHSLQQIAERLGETNDEIANAIQRHIEALAAAAAENDEQVAA